MCGALDGSDKADSGNGLLSFSFALSARPFTTQKATENHQRFTGYPPSVYMHFFLPCSSDAPCTRTAKFQVDPVPDGCCILMVTNGDGRGTDEVKNYKVILNGETVVAAGHSGNAQADVKLARSNTLKVALTGEPHSKIFVLIAYGPRQSK
jgi:hypothetical protein